MPNDTVDWITTTLRPTTSFGFGYSVGAGQTTSVHTPPAGKAVIIYAVLLDMHEAQATLTGAAFELKSNVTQRIVVQGGNNTTRQWMIILPIPIAFPINESLALKNLDSVAHVFSGFVQLLDA